MKLINYVLHYGSVFKSSEAIGAVLADVQRYAKIHLDSKAHSIELLKDSLRSQLNQGCPTVVVQDDLLDSIVSEVPGSYHSEIMEREWLKGVIMERLFEIVNFHRSRETGNRAYIVNTRSCIVHRSLGNGAPVTLIQHEAKEGEHRFMFQNGEIIEAPWISYSCNCVVLPRGSKRGYRQIHLHCEHV